ncbi:MAG: HAMP domain-containing histidine kinase, partial [Proteobacteria bacterium]|nr:HAMP domain-containing histidine kinase [Pseudomonadota bacterium]
GEGTGLGLFKVHELVKRLDGAIVAASQPNKGATFEIYLPVASVSAGA